MFIDNKCFVKLVFTLFMPDYFRKQNIIDLKGH